MEDGSLPFRLKFIYSLGMTGWSVLTNLVIVMVPFHYLPPEGEGSGPLVPQLVWFGVVNLLSIIISAGRIIDAFYDPFIARLSDRSSSPSGRRIPFMRFFTLPSALFCTLVFFPPAEGESALNAWWLAGMLALFFISATGYIIPFNALLPEMAGSAGGKVALSVASQAGFIAGIIISALCNNYSAWISDAADIPAGTALRISICALAIAGLLLMGAPALLIREKKWCRSVPSHVSLGRALGLTFSIRNFRCYLAADFSFYVALSLISSGLVYYVTVLAGSIKETGGLLMGVMVAGSLAFFPFVKRWSSGSGKKKMVISGFLALAIVFSMLGMTGMTGTDPVIWLFVMTGIAAYPVAVLGIVPLAIISEIADRHGKGNEGMFFAVKYFFVKLGQTLGIALFALLTLYGIDPGADLGLRLNGVAGAVLCLAAAMVFSLYREKEKKE